VRLFQEKESCAAQVKQASLDSQWAGRVDQQDSCSSIPTLIGSILDLNPLERARAELKLTPGFLVRSAPKPRRGVDRVGA
jgi:hypothetical protein